MPIGWSQSFWRFLPFPYLFFVNNHRFRSHYFMAYKTVGWSSSKKTIKKKKRNDSVECVIANFTTLAAATQTDRTFHILTTRV